MYSTLARLFSRWCASSSRPVNHKKMLLTGVRNFRLHWVRRAPIEDYRNEALGVVNSVSHRSLSGSPRRLEGVREVLDGTPKRFAESYGRRALTPSFRYFFFCAKRRLPDRGRGAGVTGAGPAPGKMRPGQSAGAVPLGGADSLLRAAGTLRNSPCTGRREGPGVPGRRHCPSS